MGQELPVAQDNTAIDFGILSMNKWRTYLSGVEIDGCV